MYGRGLTGPEIDVLEYLMEEGPLYEGARGDIRLPIGDAKHQEALKRLTKNGDVTYGEHRGKLILKISTKGVSKMMGIL